MTRTEPSLLAADGGCLYVACAADSAEGPEAGSLELTILAREKSGDLRSEAEDVVETSWSPSTAELFLADHYGVTRQSLPPLPSGPGSYRVRIEAIRDSKPERVWLTLWPMATAPSNTQRVTSQFGQAMIGASIPPLTTTPIARNLDEIEVPIRYNHFFLCESNARPTGDAEVRAGASQGETQNGIFGATRGCLFVWTGTQSGVVRCEIFTHDSRPPLKDLESFDDVAEETVRFDAEPLTIQTTSGDVVAEVPLSAVPGEYHVRVGASGRDEAAGPNKIFGGVERVRIDLWPALDGSQRSSIFRLTTEWARRIRRDQLQMARMEQIKNDLR